MEKVVMVVGLSGCRVVVVFMVAQVVGLSWFSLVPVVLFDGMI
jgi:hypothetical protein